MQILLCLPLVIKTKAGKTLELNPVVMSAKPSDDSATFLKFLKTEGDQIVISEKEAERCQRYMRDNKTEALSEDGVTAYTICGDMLVECLPDEFVEEEL